MPPSGRTLVKVLAPRTLGMVIVATGIAGGEMTIGFSKRSLHNLEGIHEDLYNVCRKAQEYVGKIDGLDFIITDGCRTLAEQVEFVKAGKSRTMHSRHLCGCAIDYVALVNGRVTYDAKPMADIAECFKQAAAELGIPIHWGGDWESFKDTPHIELDKRRYP